MCPQLTLESEVSKLMAMAGNDAVRYPRFSLTPQQLAAMDAVRDGADVFSPIIARALRDVEQLHPELVDIGKAQGKYGVRDVHPYFGAILTRKGREALARSAKP